jgi:choline dehydrogenase-like flavoprotein
MLLDFREAAVPDLLQADLCIVGGGAAGIAIAREFSDSGWSVILLESGGLEPDARVQDLHRGDNPRGDFTLHESRFRLLGGTTAVWGGWCAPLDELDFQSRDWVPHSGWPITRQALMPWYRRAQGLCQLGEFRYDVADWPGLGAQTLGLDGARLSHRLWQLSPPTRFGETYRGELTAAPNITLLLHATATEIVTSDSAEAVTEIRIANLEGRRGRVRARRYVAACGGIETPRLMLLSRGVEAAGLANGHDLVGRYFMEHPHPDAGGVLLSGDIRRFDAYVRRAFGKEEIVVAFGPSPDAQRRLRILNSSIAVGGELRLGPTEAWDSLTKLARAVEHGHWPASAARIQVHRADRDGAGSRQPGDAVGRARRPGPAAGAAAMAARQRGEDDGRKDDVAGRRGIRPAGCGSHTVERAAARGRRAMERKPELVWPPYGHDEDERNPAVGRRECRLPGAWPRQSVYRRQLRVSDVRLCQSDADAPRPVPAPRRPPEVAKGCVPFIKGDATL